MFRKKKEEPEIYHTPFDSTIIPPHLYPEIDLSPHTIDTTTLGDSQRRFITTTHPGTFVTYTGGFTREAQTVYYPSEYWELDSSSIESKNLMRQLEKEEEIEMKIHVEHFKDKYVCCIKNDYELLSQEKALKTLSAMKGRLMMEIAPIRIKELRCSMTPAVRKNIIQASRKAKMYGKEIPILACFDEYGRPLAERIKINDFHGVDLTIVDPEDVGELYLALSAIKFPDIKTWDTSEHPSFFSDEFLSDEFLPF